MFNGASAEGKLFQAGLSSVQLGCSQTNCNAYKVYVHGVLLVIASNTWSHELALLIPEDRDWLQANSNHVRVETPLFIGTRT